MLEIDASQGEGGGQVVRTALALATLTGQRVRLYNIRGRRKNPGLAPQHLAGVKALARICQAQVRGAALHSGVLVFEPQAPPQAGEYVFDVAEAAKGGSAGAVTLLLQTVWWPLALAGGPSTLTLRGGTHVAWSPPFHYLAKVFAPLVAELGWPAHLELNRWGFYPVGNGEIQVRIQPVLNPQPLVITTNAALGRIQGVAVAAELTAAIAQRLAGRATNGLKAAGLQAQIQSVRERAASPGAGVWLWASDANSIARAGFGALGSKGKPSELVADEAVAALVAHHRTGAAIDPHLADQLLLPLALTPGVSTFTTSALTQHLLTNAEIIQLFLPVEIEITGELEGVGQVRVQAASGASGLRPG